MKGLSLKQPFASLIAHNLKPIETRTWSTSYRGDLLICASKVPYRESGINNLFYEEELQKLFLRRVNEIDCPNGVAVAVANLIHVRNMTKDDEASAMCQYPPELYAEGKVKAWQLVNIRRIKPFPVSGTVMVFDIPERIKKQIVFL